MCGEPAESQKSQMLSTGLAGDVLTSPRALICNFSVQMLQLTPYVDISIFFFRFVELLHNIFLLATVDVQPH